MHPLYGVRELALAFTWIHARESVHTARLASAGSDCAPSPCGRQQSPLKMEKRKGAIAIRPAHKSRAYLPAFHFLLSLFCFSILLGCAAPGEPMERKPATTVPVKDLAVSQSGDSVILTFTLPKETITRHPLKEPPAIEIFRDFSAAPPGSGAAAPPTAQLIVTIPPELVAQYSPQGHFRYADSLGPEDLARHAGSEAVYFVRTRLSKKRASDNSNLAAVHVYPVPEEITDLQAGVTHSAIVLKWSPPQKTLVGPAPPIAGYEIFRLTEEPATPAAALAAAPSAPGEKPKSQPKPIKIGESAEPSFRDTQFEFGKTYIYAVRSVIQFPDGTRESADSNALVVSPKDIFPPSAPQGLVIVFVAANAPVPAHLGLSWAINPETDIAGYNIYRSEREGARGERLNSSLLLTPAFRDMTALPGRRYFYSVTAVDTAGNESPAGAPASASVPGENPAP
jgi:hypothetical protein